MRVRLSVLADTVGVPFPVLFTALCRTMPDAIGDDLTVSGDCAALIRATVEAWAA